MKIKEALLNGNKILKENNVIEYNIKTRMLLSHILGKSKEFLMIHDEDEIDDKYCEKFFAEIENLKIGIPIQYITNNQEFMGANFFVNKNVLIPQPDTEILVQEILTKVKNEYKILDLCTGSGCIGISILNLSSEKNLDVWLSDISDDALEVCKKNCEQNEVFGKIIKSNLFENINEKFNIIVSNPPYIETDTINTLDIEVRNEPKIALDGGIDGLDFYRLISKSAKSHLLPNGILGLEIGYNQKTEVIKILEKDGYIDIYSKKDYSGNDRIIICKRGE